MNYQPGDVVRLKEPRKDIEASEQMTQLLRAMTGEAGVIHTVSIDNTCALVVFGTPVRGTWLTGTLVWSEEIELVCRPGEDGAK
jgi:hypothetical protein